MSYFEIFFYFLSFALAGCFVVHMAATAIISNLEDESSDLFPNGFVSPSNPKTKAHSPARQVKRRALPHQLTSAR